MAKAELQVPVALLSCNKIAWTKDMLLNIILVLIVVCVLGSLSRVGVS